MSKTTCLTVLVCLNLILVTAILLLASPPRAALAQGAGLADNYMMVAGEVQDDFDALYIIDVRERTMHTFFFRRGTRELDYGGYRLLDQDLRNNRN